MKSIRHRLLFWLLTGVGVLLLGAGACAFFAIRYVLLDEIDTELQQARKVIHNLYERNALAPGVFSESAEPASGRTPRLREEERWRSFDRAEGKLFYQVRVPEGEILQCSPSLEDRTIDRPMVIPDPRRSITLTMSDETRIRARIDYAILTNRPPESGTRERVEIIVARDLVEVNHTLSLFLAGIAAVGILAALAIAGLVTVLLRKTLAPLRQLGEEVSGIDASKLTSRFDVEGMPEELLPIGRRLNHLMQRLETSFERERRFSSDLAHELRTPIAELTAMAETAIRFPTKIPSDQYEEILATSQEMGQIVESLLAVARWEDENSELNFEKVDLAKITEECWEPFSRSARERELEVNLSLVPGQSLSTDPILFRHILTNLFSNAVDYTPAGGKLAIQSLSPENQPGGGLIVSNTVENLSASDLPHLFDRFWRHDPSRTGGKHSGLGLSVAHSCAETLSLALSATLEEGVLRFELSPKGSSQ